MFARIGKYEVQSEIGHGAFGRVFRGYDPQMRRPVAIKVLIADKDPDMLSRFRAEAGAAGNLDHKNIVTVHDYNDEEGKPYIVMQLLDGESLLELIARRAPLSVLDKVRILLQAAEGLAYAHRKGVIHRDIKPANIMLLPNGEVKIMDFGIARIASETETRRTRVGDLVGTILYMAPERIHNNEADACSDIFSFGVVAYELLSGKHAFDGKDYAAAIYNITSVEPKPLRELASDCPEALEMLVHQTMAKDREARYQSLDDVIFDLRPIAIELARQMAVSLMSEVTELRKTGQEPEAQEKARKALELDPSNRDARAVHESLVDHQRRSAVRARIEKLVNDGQAQVSQRHFSQAIQLFESALRLESSDPKLQELLTHAKVALEASRQSSRTLAEARRELLADNVEAAFAGALKAVELDPNNQEAAGFAEKLRQRVEERGKRARIEDALHRAENRLAQNEFQAARSELATIQEEVDAGVLSDLRLRIDSEEAEHARHLREAQIQDGLAKARQQAQALQLSAATQTLESLAAEFPDAEAVQKALENIKDQAAANQRAEAIGQVTRQARSLIQAEKYVEACELLGEGIRDYPDDISIQRLLNQALALHTANQRSKAIRGGLARAQDLRKAGKLADSLTLIDRLLAEHGHDATLSDYKRQIEFDQEQERYSATLRASLERSKELLAAGKFAEAVAILEAATRDYSGEPEFTSLLLLARRKKAEQEERDSVDQAIRRIEEFEKRQHFEAALSCAEAALRQYPQHSALAQMAERNRENLRAQRRGQSLTRHQTRIEQAIADHDWARAAIGIRAARQEFPSETALDELEKRAQRGQSDERMAEFTKRAQECFAKGDLPEAARVIEAGREFSERPQYLALQGELDRLRGQQRQLAEQRRLESGKTEVRTLLEGDNFTDALTVLLRLESDFSTDVEVPQLRQAAEHQRDRSEAIARLEDLERRGEIDAALAMAEKILLSSPRDGRVQQTVSRLRTRRAQDLEAEEGARRERTLREGREQTNGFLAKGELNHALKTVEALCTQFPDDRSLVELHSVIGQRIEIAFINRTLAQLADLVTQKRYKEAIQEGERAVQQYPGNKELLAAVRNARSVAAQEEKQREVATLARKIESALLERNWNTGNELLRGGLAKFPGEEIFAHLRKKLMQGQRQAELEAFRAAVGQCFAEGDLDKATGMIAAQRPAFSTESIWQNLERELNLRRNYETSLKEAERLRQSGALERSESLLRELISGGAPDTRAATVLHAITSERSQRERKTAIARAQEETDRLLGENRLPEALGVLDRASNEYPDDVQLARRRDELQSRIVQEKQNSEKKATDRRQAAGRARKMELLRAPIDGMIAAGQWEQALKAIAQAELEFPNEHAFVELRVRVLDLRRNAALTEIERRAREYLDKGDLDGAARQLAATSVDLAGDVRLRKLETELDRRRQYEALLSEAEELCIQGNYPAAREKLKSIQDAPDRRAETMLREIEAGRGARAKATRRNRSAKPFLLAGVGLLLIAALIILLKPLIFRSAPKTATEAKISVPGNTGAKTDTEVTPPPKVLLKAFPNVMTFWYVAGAKDVAPQDLNFQPGGFAFKAGSSPDWLAISPKSGGALDHLQVRVKSGLAPGTYSGKINIHSDSPLLENHDVEVGVTLLVTSGENSKPPQPVILTPDSVKFSITAGENPQGPQTLTVKAGEIQDATSTESWIRVKHTKTSLEISLVPEGIEFADHEVERAGRVMVQAADARLQPIPLIVYLTARPKTVGPITHPPGGDTGSTIGERRPPAGTGCSQTATTWRGTSQGRVTWIGVLNPSESIFFTKDGPYKSNGEDGRWRAIDPPYPPISIRPLDLKLATNGLKRLDLAKNCGPIELRNDSGHSVTTIDFQWSVDNSQ